jgi:hypothetical protein
MRRPGRWLATLTIVAATALMPVGVAKADCDTPGDFGAGSGCPPPGSDSSGGGSGGESWPPTSVDWPPQFESALGGDSEKSKAPPIVMPDGATSHAAEKASPPIVGAGSDSTPSTTATSTPIVMPGN